MKRIEHPSVAREDAPRTETEWLDHALDSRADGGPSDIVIVDGPRRVTCAELAARVHELAHFLQLRDIGPGRVVGLHTKRSVERVVGLLGILESGAAWLALDDHDPASRLASLLRTLHPDLVLTQNQLRGRLGDWPGKVMALDEIDRIGGRPDEFARAIGSPNDLARVAYSFDRGILGTRRGLRNHLLWLQQQFSLDASDVVLNRTSPSIDAGIREILWPVLCGGKLVLAPDPLATDAIADFLVEHAVSVLQLNTSELTAWMAASREHSASSLSSLRQILVHGEPLSRSMVEAFHEITGLAESPETEEDESVPEISLTYLYDVPEAGTSATSLTCASGIRPESAPLGQSTHVSVYVLDRHLRPVPFGVVGEICVCGEGMARGYLGDPQTTALRFRASPFAGRPGERLFRTGDMGRQRRDGTIELVGPARGTAWVGGGRYALEEIEDVLLREPSVRECVVRARTSDSSGSRLWAYVVSSGPFQLDRLRAHVLLYLPASLASIEFVPVASLPRTSAGRLDEQGLERLATIDSGLIERWESTLREVPEIAEVAVVAQERREAPRLLHLSDLIDVHVADSPRPAPLRTQESPGASLPSSSGRLAMSEGEPLRPSPDEPVTLGDVLHRAAQMSHNEAVIHIGVDQSERVQTYSEMLSEARAILAGLNRSGLSPGDKVLFQLEDTRDFVPAFWACVLGGLVPAPLAVPPTISQPNGALTRLRQAWELLEEPIILADAGLAWALVEFQGLGGEGRARVIALDELRRETAEPQIHDAQPEDLATLLLTSGSTGSSKGVMLSHRSVLSMCAGTVQRNGFTRQDVSLNWVGLDHVGALVPHLIMPTYLGCRQIHAPTRPVLEDPLRWLDWLARYRVTIAWAPNFVYGLINDRAEAIASGQWDLSALRFLINAGETVVTPTARRFLKLLEPHRLQGSAMHPAFGMSETCSGITWSDRFPPELDRENESRFVDLGPPIPGASLRIVDDQGELVEEGVIGRFQVKGPSVASGYYRNPELTRAAFHVDGWLETGDLGLLREGRLTLTGREKDVIIINGVNYPNHAIEASVEEVEGVEPSWTAACAVPPADASTEQLAIVFSPRAEVVDPPVALIRSIRERVIRNFGINPTYILPLPTESIPRTAIGKIQRPQLVRRIQAGEFDDRQKQIDLALGGPRTLPDWFYRTIWRRREGTPRASRPGNARVLLLQDSSGLASRLSDAGGTLAETSIVVEAGSTFERLSANHFRIHPGEPGHYAQLFDALVDESIAINHVIHLGTYTVGGNAGLDLQTFQDSLPAGVTSLLNLVQALVRRSEATRPSELLVVASRSQATAARDSVSPERGLVAGLVPTIAQELPWLRCRHLDLEGAQLDRDANSLLSELAMRPTDLEVAYREGRRLVPRLERIDWSREEPPRVVPIRRGGSYLLSGGLGGIGRELARWLLIHWQARLLLIGRTPLPPRDEWKSGENRNGPSRDRIEALRQFESLGTVVYESLDVGDENALRAALNHVERDWGSKVDGIFHLAGERHECALTEETSRGFAEAIWPKVAGGLVLDLIARERPGCLFVAFSSVNSVFGGSRAGAYSASNRFLELLTHQQRQRGRSASWCIPWSQWDDIGMSRDSAFKEVARHHGFLPISADEGLNSLQVVLARAGQSVVVGIDGANPYLRSQVESPDTGTQRLVAYYTARAEPPTPSRLQALDVRDAFQRRSDCVFVLLPELPRDDSGTLDRARLSAMTDPTVLSERSESAPRTEEERQLVRLWQEVLQVPRVSIHDNFFELGGHSLLAAQLMARIAATMEVDLPLGTLFSDPTVAGLARAVESARLGGPSVEPTLDLRAEAVLDPSIQPGRPPVDPSVRPAQILLTGATGFLGAFLLRDLLEHTTARVSCLVRAPSAFEGMSRIQENLASYCLWRDEYASRLDPIVGDLARPRLGLSVEDLGELAERIDVIYHNGALVNFLYPYQALKAANVEGTTEVIRLACSGQVKPVHYVSTLSVFPLIDLSGAGVAREDASLSQPETLMDGYSQSKWVAEQRLLAARARGLPVSIYRPARITGDSRTGVGEADDFMWKLIGQCLQSGLTPAVEVQVDMTPVDFASRAIVALSIQSNEQRKTFHLANPSPISWSALNDWLRARGYPLQQVSATQWKDKVSALVGRQVESSLFAWLPLVSALAADDGPLVLPQLRHDCENTLKGLERTGIACPPVDGTLLDTYFNRLVGNGILAPPPTRAT